MGNKILNQLYHSCNVTRVMPRKNTCFLKLWPCEVLTTPDCSMACCMLFGKKLVFATHTPLKTWSQIAQDCPISATLPQAWGDAAAGDSGGSGMLQSSANPAGRSISSQIFGQLSLPHTHPHATMWVQAMDSFSPGITQDLLFVPHASQVADFEEEYLLHHKDVLSHCQWEMVKPAPFCTIHYGCHELNLIMRSSASFFFPFSGGGSIETTISYYFYFHL